MEFHIVSAEMNPHTMEGITMLALQDAVSKSLSILKETFVVPQDIPVELEEARRQEDPDEWVLTFSYPDSTTLPPDDIGRYLGRVLRNKRTYKEIRIKAMDGEVMGVRNLHL